MHAKLHESSGLTALVHHRKGTFRLDFCRCPCGVQPCNLAVVLGNVNIALWRLDDTTAAQLPVELKACVSEVSALKESFWLPCICFFFWMLTSAMMPSPTLSAGIFKAQVEEWNIQIAPFSLESLRVSWTPPAHPHVIKCQGV